MKKLKSQAGMTLGEVLISVLILLMITAIVAEGIPLAQRAYYKVVDSANAQVLLSTTATVLRDELSMAQSAPVCNAEKTSITYYSEKQGRTLTLSDTDNIGAKSFNLVSSGLLNNERLVIQFKNVDYNNNNGIVTFSNLKVTKQGEDANPLAEIDSYEIKVLNN